MTKKVLIALAILSFCIATIFVYNFYKNTRKTIKKETIKAVPQNAILVFKSKNLEHAFKLLNSSNIIWEELTNNSSFFSKIHTQLTYVDSILKNNSIISLQLNKDIQFSIHSNGADDFNILYYFSTLTKLDDERLINALKTATRSNPTSRSYENSIIYNFVGTDSSQMYMSYTNEIILFSSSSLLLEDAIRQSKSETSLLNNSTFASAYHTSGESDFGNVFINTASIHKLFNKTLTGSAKNYSKNSSLFGGWTSLDFYVKSNSLALSGFTNSSDSSGQFLSLFKNQKAQAIELLNVVPYNTSFLYYNSFENFKLFIKEKKNLLEFRKKYDLYSDLIDFYNTHYQMDIEEEWLNFMGNEMALIVSESRQDSISNENCYIVFQVKDVEKTKGILENIALKINQENYPTTLFNEHAISKIDLTNFFQTFFGKPFVNFLTPYYTLSDNYLIFGNSEIALQNYIQNLTLNRTLENDENYKLFKENLSLYSSIFIYNNIARSSNLYTQFLEEEYQSILKEKTDLIKKFEAVAIQLSHEKNSLFYTNLFLKYNPATKQEIHSVWETQIDGDIATDPEIVINHVDNTKEIIVQDNLNQLYLISNTGKIIWKKQLNEKIIGKIHQVDALKNNKLQLIFNTSSKIFLLDRNGNNVGKFPVALPSPATIGLEPLDYEKNKNYRILIGCENNQLYNYDIEGNLVKGWEYNKGKSAATQQIYHFVSDKKDYIVVSLKDGSIRLLERNGKDRVFLKNKLPNTNNQIIVFPNMDLKKSYAVSSDSLGNVIRLFFTDKNETLNFENEAGAKFFSSFDLNNDNANEILFTNGNKITVYNTDKKIILTYQTETEITQPPKLFKLKTGNKIGLVSGSTIHLINEKGISENNFPLTGSSVFKISDLSNNGKLNIVVGDRNTVYMYNLE